MLKKIALILLTTTLCLAEPIQDISHKDMPLRKTIITTGVGAGNLGAAEPAQNSKLFKAASIVGALGLSTVLLAVCIVASDALSNSLEFSAASVETLSKIGCAGVVIGGIGVGTGGVVVGRSVIQAMNSHFYPNEEQKIERELILAEMREKLKFLEAQKAFRDCLMKDRPNRKQGASGLPNACEELAETFAIFGGREEVEEMKSYFSGE